MKRLPFVLVINGGIAAKPTASAVPPWLAEALERGEREVERARRKLHQERLELAGGAS